MDIVLSFGFLMLKVGFLGIIVFDVIFFVLFFLVYLLNLFIIILIWFEKSKLVIGCGIGRDIESFSVERRFLILLVLKFIIEL